MKKGLESRLQPVEGHKFRRRTASAYLYRLKPGLQTCWRAAQLLTISALFLVSSSAVAAGKFRIASRGKPAAEIVLEAERPELPLAFAAEELQRYVKLMSGAELPI